MRLWIKYLFIHLLFHRAKTINFSGISGHAGLIHIFHSPYYYNYYLNNINKE